MLRDEIRQVESIAQTAADAVAKFLCQELIGLKMKIEKLESDIVKMKAVKTKEK